MFPHKLYNTEYDKDLETLIKFSIFFLYVRIIIIVSMPYRDLIRI